MSSSEFIKNILPYKELEKCPLEEKFNFGIKFFKLKKDLLLSYMLSLVFYLFLVNK